MSSIFRGVCRAHRTWPVARSTPSPFFLLWPGRSRAPPLVCTGFLGGSFYGSISGPLLPVAEPPVLLLSRPAGLPLPSKEPLTSARLIACHNSRKDRTASGGCLLPSQKDFGDAHGVLLKRTGRGRSSLDFLTATFPPVAFTKDSSSPARGHLGP